MEFFDSHAHYTDDRFEEDRNEIIEAIYNDGITKFLSAGYNIESISINLSQYNNSAPTLFLFTIESVYSCSNTIGPNS